MSRRGKIALAVAAAVVFALAAWREATRPPEESAPAPVPLREAEPAPEPSEPAEAPKAPNEPAPLQGNAAPSFPALESLAAGAARDYRERARFPPWSAPIVDGVDPLVRDREVVPARSLPPDLWPVLEIAPDRTTYVHPAPVRVRATLRDPSGAVAPGELSGQVRDDRGATVAELRFREAPALGSSGPVYRATLDVAELPGEPLRGAYLIAVRAVSRDGDERIASSGFLYSVPLAALTGRYRDALVDGDLHVEAELDVSRPARFHLEATLADEDGRPIAWAQAAEELEPGLAWLALRFSGLAIRERGIDGPYSLASIALTTVDGMPNQKSDRIADAHRTRPWAATDFSDEPYGDPYLLRAAEELEDR